MTKASRETECACLMKILPEMNGNLLFVYTNRKRSTITRFIIMNYKTHTQKNQLSGNKFTRTLYVPEMGNIVVHVKRRSILYIYILCGKKGREKAYLCTCICLWPCSNDSKVIGFFPVFIAKFH